MQIKLDNISKEYKDLKAIENLSLEINSPAMIGFLGPNGAGKSTIMKMLVGQLLPTRGKITIDGIPLNENERYLKERLGYLPQDFGLYEELRIEEFLDYMACLKGINKNKIEAINRAISMTSLEEKRKFKIKTLSGGQKQRVGIAQAILNSPELLIVDEPTVGLDPEERIRFRNLFSEGSKEKIVILSTHIIEDIEAICNYIIVLNKGKILFVGEPNKLVKEALGHVGIIEITGNNREKILESEISGEFKITSTVVTLNGTRYKVVSDNLPSSFEKATPSLEDAYVYCMLKGETENAM
ncbi:MAG: ABC transporter ATP-binding protein [Tissierellaceae bacterium]